MVAQCATRKGAAYLASEVCPVYTIGTLAEMAEFVQLAEKSKAQTIVLDDFNEMVRAWVAQCPASNEPRTAYRIVNDRLVPLLRRVWASGKHVVITTHKQTEQEFTPTDGFKGRVTVMPDLPDALGKWVMGMATLGLYVWRDGQGVVKALTSEEANDKRRIWAKQTAGMQLGKVVDLTSVPGMVGK